MTQPTPEPVTLTIGRAILEDGKIAIQPNTPDAIQLQPGQPLHVQAQYRFEESNRESEQFRVRLRSHIGDDRPDDAVQSMNDRPLITDSEWGFVRQSFAAPAPGTYELWVDLRAEYGVHPWDGKGSETLDVAELAVAIPLTVA